MGKLTVALLSGGISSEREVSINSGNQVFEALDKDKYNVVRYDPKDDIPKLVSDAERIDVALVILHGPYGEDGTIQGLLDLLGIPYQGSGVLGSAAAMNKLVAKQLYRQAGLMVPDFVVVETERRFDAAACVGSLGLPLVIKPLEGGSSVGMSIVRTEGDLKEALDKAFVYDRRVLIEAFIEGMEITGGVMGNDPLDALPLIEIIPNPSYEFFDYEAKYKPGATEEICPARIDDDLAARAKDCAKKAHQALSCKGYSRTDMIVKDGAIFVLETNTIPGMTPTSLFPQAAAAFGYSFSAMLDRLIELGMEDMAGRVPE
ncbi:D-alanine--D-alanine ligase (EC [Olavius algarvensis associated proteobacterium Delta 3]|nr:D-alanine--D-alanine ligase (EC [Olavius algarvensis associated proteobacterium Delta 3]CAB5135543.1 D-alanine--D-alanine ligase (EC [Olavius algarvensis associated proteobacterium Delta 3]